MRVQFYSMVKTAQSKAGPTILLALFLGFIPNSGAARPRWRGAQTGNVSPQAAPAQTTDKKAEELKVRESLNRLLDVARKRAEEYNKLFRDLAAEEKRTSICSKSPAKNRNAGRSYASL
jgi:hypothetical protein